MITHQYGIASVCVNLTDKIQCCKYISYLKEGSIKSVVTKVYRVKNKWLYGEQTLISMNKISQIS